MITVSWRDIPLPAIPTFEELQKLTLDSSLDLWWAIRRSLLEVLVCQPDMYPRQLDQLPESVKNWIKHAQEEHEEAFIRGEYDSGTRFAFWLEKLAQKLWEKGFRIAVTPREKQVFARNCEGVKSLKAHCNALFDELWDFPLKNKKIQPDFAIILEEILPWAFRYLQLRGVAILQNNSKE